MLVMPVHVHQLIRRKERPHGGLLLLVNGTSSGHRSQSGAAGKEIGLVLLACLQFAFQRVGRFRFKHCNGSFLYVLLGTGQRDLGILQFGLKNRLGLPSFAKCSDSLTNAYLWRCPGRLLALADEQRGSQIAAFVLLGFGEIRFRRAVFTVCIAPQLGRLGVRARIHLLRHSAPGSLLRDAHVQVSAFASALPATAAQVRGAACD
jgi:hypothetical protein